MADVLLALKAGRAFRQENSNTVDPSPTKGAIILTIEDGLLHFTWKNRTTDVVDEDLILFPSDASFVKVPQASGRVYVLKFSSSNQRHFFWLQDASTARDEEFVANINRLLDNPEAELVWNNTSAGPSQPQASTSAQPAATSSAATAPLISPEQLAQLQALLSGGRGAPAAPEYSLTDILTPANLAPLFASHPELISTLFPHLPPDLPVPPSPEALQRIINSPQFRAAVSNFDQALRTGLLGGLVRTLGLPEEAGLGIEPFLRAVQEQADKDKGPGDDSRMDTD